MGQSDYDQVFFVEIDRNDNVFLLGQSRGGLFPITPGVYSNGNSSNFIIKLNPNLDANLASTRFGNGSSDIHISPSAFLVDVCGNVYVSGWGANILQGVPLSGMPVTQNSAFQANPPNGFDFYLIVLENLRLTDIGDYYYFHWLLNSIEIPFTLICVLFLINAFNYFDGIDGSLSFTSISVLIILYYLSNDESVRLFLTIVGLPIFVYLFFNFGLFNLPKLFLGDSGSLLLGFVISFTLIYFAKMKIAHPILMAWSVSIFVFEFLSINLQRIKNNKNPFKAGLDHLHHYFFNKTKSVLLTNFLLSTINIIFFVIGYISFKFSGPIASLILFTVFFVIYFTWRNVYIFEK